MIDVSMLSRSLRLAIMDNGESIPVVQWVDGDGEDCGPDDGVVCVAGPDAAGKWHTIDLTQLERTVLQ